jgi:Spy/CpxP family protein refolding chaperone
MKNLSRRSLFKLAGLGTAAGAGALASRNIAAGVSAQGAYAQGGGHAAMGHGGGHLMGAVGRVTPGVFNPTA